MRFSERSGRVPRRSVEEFFAIHTGSMSGATVRPLWGIHPIWKPRNAGGCCVRGRFRRADRHAAQQLNLFTSLVNASAASFTPSLNVR